MIDQPDSSVTPGPRASEFRTLAETIPQLVWTTRPDGYHDYFNDRWYAYTGMPRGGENGWDWKNFLHPDDYDRSVAAWSHSLTTGEAYQIEYRFRDAASGAYRWFIGRALPLRDDAGTIVRWFGTCTDIEDQKAAEGARDRALAEVQLERARLQEVFATAPSAIAVSEGRDHVQVFANRTYRELTGNRPLAGRPVREAFPELEGQGFFELLDQVYATGTPFAGREVAARLDRDGDGVPEAEGFFDFDYQPLRDVDGTITGILTHAVDVTAQVLARRDMERKAQELARVAVSLERSNRELDQFAYVASHDLKAPLRGIANLTQWIAEDLGDRVTGESREHMRLLQGRVQRMEALIDGILAYSRAGRTRVAAEPVDLGMLVRDAVELLGSAPHVRIELPDDLPTIVAERVPLQQLFLNLLGNAVKYTSAFRADPVVRVTWQDEGEQVAIAVADNGPGIAPEYHERIWGLFQTLQARDKVEGTGIGLSVVRKIVETRGGRAWVESTPGQGATFHVTLPRVERGDVPLDAG